VGIVLFDHLLMESPMRAQYARTVVAPCDLATAPGPGGILIPSGIGPIGGDGSRARARIRVCVHELKQVLSTLFAGGY